MQTTFLIQTNLSCITLYCLGKSYYKNLLEIMNNFEVFTIFGGGISEKSKTFYESHGYTFQDVTQQMDDICVWYKNEKFDRKAFTVYRKTLTAADILRKAEEKVAMVIVDGTPENDEEILSERKIENFGVFPFKPLWKLQT
jgi:hypothetical protein